MLNIYCFLDMFLLHDSVLNVLFVIFLLCYIYSYKVSNKSYPLRHASVFQQHVGIFGWNLKQLCKIYVCVWKYVWNYLTKLCSCNQDICQQ